VAADPSLALQKAITAALKGTTDAGGNVFDTVPGSDPFPRITVGDGQSLPDYADCYDGTISVLQIDVWSRAVGWPEAKRIASQVREALDDGEFALDEHHLEVITFEDAQFLRDPDGLTRHVALTFRALTQPA
jgi:hypothetical protein